jgi:hypothetical protein
MADLEIPILECLFTKITQGLQSGKTLESMKGILEMYSGDDWNNHISFSDTKYNRKKVFQNDQIELIVISWKAQQHTLIHDHPEGGCVMKVLSGLLCEDKYSENAEIYLNTTCLDKGSISYSKGKDILHQILARLDSVSIHIYAPPNYVPNVYL